MIGKSILHYKILEKLGEGGMGIVWKAEDTKLNRLVAIKVLPPHLLVSEDDRARFHREAKAAAALNHSNIATVYEINESEEKPFIVMEYVEGQTLDKIIGAENLLPLQDAISIAVQIADGLEAAHKKGVVHRDIKASNILYSTEKKAKILDFGLAKTSMSTKLTRMGTTIGTVAYMSPEQVQGKEVDHRSDLWSLGVLLYEMITGHLPFKAEYDQAIFYSIQNENPDPLTAIRSGVPMALEWIVNKLMAKDPAGRYQSANDLIIDLKAVDLNSSGFSRTTVRTVAKEVVLEKKSGARTNPYKPLAIVAIVFLVYFMVQYFVSTNSQDKESMYFNISALEDESIQVSRSDVQVIAISPDGTKIVYTVVDRGNPTLYLKSLKDFKITKLDGLGNVAGGPVFSPDGNYIIFNSDSQLKRISLATGAVDVIHDRPAFRGVSWVDNNKIIYSGSYSSALSLINLSSGKLTELTTLDSLRGERTHRWPQVLPDGKHVLFTIGNVNSPNSYEEADLAIVSLEDGSKHILSAKGEMARYVEPGYMIIGKNGKLMAAPFDLSTYKFLAPPQPVLHDVEGDVGSGISYFGLSENGNIIYIKGQRNQSMQLFWANKKGGVEALPVPENPYMIPRIAPDGKKILINIGAQSTSRDVWLYDFNTALLRRMTFGMSGLYPEWNAGGDGFYFMSLSATQTELTFQSLISGEKKIIKKFSSSTATSILSVSKDDKFMLLNVVGDNNDWTWQVLDLQSREFMEIPVVNQNRFGGDFSPDGKYIAYSTDETNRLEVFITDFPKMQLKWQISNSGGGSVRWSPDGSALFYINDNGKMMVVPVSYTPGFQPGKPRELIDVSDMFFPNDNSDNYDVAPDGERFLMVKNSNAQAQLSSFNMIYNWTAELDKIFSK